MNKRRTIKKGLAILLVVAMLFSIMPVSAFAENTDSTEPGGQKLMNMQSKTTTPAAYVTIGDETTPYETLNEAINAASAGTANNPALVEVAKDIDDLDFEEYWISSSVFTIDLKGKTLSIDSSNGLPIGNANITVKNGTIIASHAYTGPGSVTVAGGSVVTIAGCTLQNTAYGVYIDASTVTITGGIITGGVKDLLVKKEGSVKLYEGVTFPNGIEVSGADLEDILGDGMAYWQGETMITLTEGQTEITGGDVTVKAIPKQTPTYTAPVAKTGLVYDGSAQPLITAGKATGGTMQYSLDNANWNDAIPTGSNAGTYTVYYKVVGDSTHNDVAAQNITVTIDKATPTYVAPTDLTATYGDTLADVTLTTGWAWVNSDISVGTVGSNSFGATFTPADIDNYNTVSADVTVVVNKATVAKPTIESKVYTGAVLKADVAENELYTVTTNNGGTAKGSYPVVLTLRDSANYKWNTVDTADVTLQFVITDVENRWTTEPSIAGWSYGEEANAPVYAAQYGTVVVEYKAAAAEDSAYSTAVPTGAGDYKVRFSVAATENYGSLTEVVDLAIAKVSVTITADDKAITAGDALPTLTYIITGDVVSGDNLGIAVNCTGDVNTAGTYPIVVTAANANYDITLVNGTLTVNAQQSSGNDDNDENNPPQGDGNGDNNTGEGSGDSNEGGTDNDSTSTPSYSYTPSTPAAKPEITVPDNAVGEDVKVEAEKITTSTLNDVKDIASDDDKLSVIGGKDSAVQIKATEDNKAVESFTQPVTVTVPVSKSALKNVEDVNKLTLALVTEDENGDTVLTYVGGNYDAEEGTFSAYTDKPGNYVLVEKQDIVKMNLLIGNLASTINGETVINDVAPYIVNDRTMVPVAFIMGNLGCQVEWINDERKVVIILPDGEQLSMIIDQEIPGFGGIPVIKNDRTMVPIAYIADAIGANVMWIEDEHCVVIVK